MAAARANIENIEAQLTVQQAQISADQAQVDKAQAALVFSQEKAARYEYLATQSRARFRMPSNTPRSCIRIRPHWTVRKRR